MEEMMFWNNIEKESENLKIFQIVISFFFAQIFTEQIKGRTCGRGMENTGQYRLNGCPITTVSVTIVSWSAISGGAINNFILLCKIVKS